MFPTILKLFLFYSWLGFPTLIIARETNFILFIIYLFAYIFILARDPEIII